MEAFLKMKIIRLDSIFRYFKITFLENFALNVRANCICDIHWMALDGFDLKTFLRKLNLCPGPVFIVYLSL